MNNLSLAQRLMADTPAFFKKVHMFGLFLVGLAVSLNGVLPPQVGLIGGVVGGTLATLSMFAVKDIGTVQAAPSTLGGLVDAIPDLVDQFKQVKDVITTHAAANTGTLNQIAGSLAVLASPAAAADQPAQNADSLLQNADNVVQFANTGTVAGPAAVPAAQPFIPKPPVAAP